MSESVAPNVRYAQIHYGDTLQRIALRELGDSSRWLDLVGINNLRPPFVSELGGSGILAWGDTIKVPASASTVSADISPELVFGRDLALPDGTLAITDGDVSLKAGIPNLSQSLTHRVVTEKRELGFHPPYGCWVRSLLGAVNGASAGQLAAFYVRSALLEDDRVASVASCDAVMEGDQIQVRAVVLPTTGGKIDFKVLI